MLRHEHATWTFIKSRCIEYLWGKNVYAFVRWNLQILIYNMKKFDENIKFQGFRALSLAFLPTFLPGQSVYSIYMYIHQIFHFPYWCMVMVFFCSFDEKRRRRDADREQKKSEIMYVLNIVTIKRGKLKCQLNLFTWNQFSIVHLLGLLTFADWTV